MKKGHHLKDNKINVPSNNEKLKNNNDIDKDKNDIPPLKKEIVDGSLPNHNSSNSRKDLLNRFHNNRKKINTLEKNINGLIKMNEKLIHQIRKSNSSSLKTKEKKTK